MDARIRKQQHALNGRNKNSSNVSTHDLTSPSPQPTKRVLTKHTGSLEIIEGNASELYIPSSDVSDTRPPSQAGQRPWSRSSVGSIPPRPDSSLSKRLATPTKHVTLQAVRRKEESSEPFMPEVDFQTLSLDSSYNRVWDITPFTEEDPAQVTDTDIEVPSDLTNIQHATQLRLPRQPETREASGSSSRAEDRPGPSRAIPASSAQEVETEVGAAGGRVVDNPGGSTEETDDEDDGEESSEEEERKAPNELLMEFVECLMKKDYKNADKLCKMILLYEPMNPEALKFQPVIEEKLRLDAEAEAAEDEGDEEGGDDDDNDDDEDDDDDDDDEDDEDEDDSSSDDDSDDSDDEEESVFRIMAEAVSSNYYASREPAGDPRLPQRPDSGVHSEHEQ